MTRVSEAPLRVLVVDDEALIVWSLSETLRGNGHTVVGAASAGAAREAIGHQQPFDVVLLDYRLPDSHGLELLEDIRRRAPRTAVVFMTAYGTPDLIQGALDRGAYCVISKPFDVHDVEPLIWCAYRALRPQ
jgi:DNA-binding NtrC family response regulator